MRFCGTKLVVWTGGFICLTLVVALGMGCSGSQEPSGQEGAEDPTEVTQDDPADNGDTSNGDDEIVPGGGAAHPSCGREAIVQEAPESESMYRNAGFTRYAEVVSDNGGKIKIFAAPGTGDERVRRAHAVLSFFLQNAPGSRYGFDKTEVANKMAANGAVLVMPTGADGEGPEMNLPAQPLYENETPVEGSAWYMENDYEHRDAALEEIFHLVHDTGIGTEFPGALPEYQIEMRNEAELAITERRWGIPVDPEVNTWLQELRAEDSLAQEYIAAVIDSYYGLWAPWDEGTGGMWGIYIAKDRAEIVEKDPAGLGLLESFLGPWLDYEVHLAAELDGDFHMSFDASKPYTHKSQYLVQVTLTGSNASSVYGNAQDNTLRGNSANNNLDGSSGNDTAVYCNQKSDYTVTREGPSIVVDGPHGRDVLSDIEIIHFSDGAISSSDI